MKISPDGKQLISLPHNDFGSTEKQPELFDFDASSGKLNSKFVLPFSSFEPYYGASFSPNGQVVYFSATNWYGGIRLHQYNLQAPTPTDIIASRYMIEDNSFTNWYDGYSFGSPQLGPDGKIYVSFNNPQFNYENNFLNHLSVINNPNILGAGCTYQRKYIKTLCGSYSYWGMPNFIESYFRTPPSSPPCNNTLPLEVEFTYTVNACSREVSFQSNVSNLKDAVSYSWDFADLSISNGGANTFSQVNHIYSKPGLYAVTLTVQSATECQSYKVIKQVTIPAVPILGADTVLCHGSSLLLSLEPKNGNYAWQDKTTQATFLVTSPGTYWVDITLDDCTYRDSIQVGYESLPNVHLGSEITICQEATALLDVTTPYATYLWQDGWTQSSYLVQKPALYWIDIKLNNCITRETVLVKEQLPAVIDLGVDTTLCSGESLTLSAYKPAASYLWSNGSLDAHLEISEPGTYWVRVSQGACISMDSIHINYKDCINFIPNVITPNGDEKNDIFVIEGIKVENWSLIIYNRWGKEIFISENYKNNWSAKGLDGGIYYYTLVNDKNKRIYKGVLHVLR
jgi:gliding motility-associated-like protein